MNNKKVMVKNRFFVMALCLSVLTTGFAQNGAELLHERLTAFAKSGEYDVHRVDSTNPYVRAYRFEKMFGMESISDDMFLFESLRMLDRAFFSEAGRAQEVYLHNAKEGDSPLSGIQIQIGEAPVMGRAVAFLPSENIRLLSFNKPNGYRHCFLLTWKQYLKKDAVPGPHFGQIWYMSGEIYEFEGKKPENVAYMSVYQPKSSPKSSFVGSESVKAASYEELEAKVKRLCQIFERETEQGRTSAVVVLNRLCNDYGEKLTDKQYSTLITLLNPLIEKSQNKNHQNMIGLSCATLYWKSDCYKENEEAQEMKERGNAAHIEHSTVTMSNLSKMVTYTSTILSDAEQVECTIMGRTEPDASSVTLMRWPQMEPMGEYPVDAGEFTIKCKLPKNEIIQLFGKDGQTQFVADGNQVFANLSSRIALSVRSGMDIQRTDLFMQRVNATEKQLWEVKDKDESREEYLSYLRRLLRDSLATNRDNLISAFSLFKSYSEMNAEQLRPYMGDDYAFSGHPLLAPVREYYEGLLKRQPGMPFVDAEVKDPAGIIHHLSEYVGKDYVLLHFWRSNSPMEIKTSGLTQMKTLYETYHPQGLNIVSIALDGDNYPQGWREEIEEQQMAWTQLWADDGMESPVAQAYGIHAIPETVLIDPDGTIVASPATMQALEAELRKIYSTN